MARTRNQSKNDSSEPSPKKSLKSHSAGRSAVPPGAQSAASKLQAEKPNKSARSAVSSRTKVTSPSPEPISTRTLRNRSTKSSQNSSTTSKSGNKRAPAKSKGLSVSSSVENDGDTAVETHPEIESHSSKTSNSKRIRPAKGPAKRMPGNTVGSLVAAETGEISPVEDVDVSMRSDSRLSASIKQSSTGVRLKTAQPKIFTPQSPSGASLNISDAETSALNTSNLSVELRPRKSVKKLAPVEDDFNVDDNLDFDFSDKDSDFDVGKELQKRPRKKRDINLESESSEDEWEAVAEKVAVSDDDDDLGVASTSKAPIEILVKMPDAPVKTGFDVDKWLGAQLRKRKREIVANIHRVHLLACLAHGQYLSQTIGQNERLLGLALSFWDRSNLLSRRDLLKLDVAKLEQLVAAIKEKFALAEAPSGQGMLSVSALATTMTSRRCPSYLHLALLMLLMLRSLGVDVRLVYSMQPLAGKDAKESKTKPGNAAKKSPNKTGKAGSRKRAHSTDAEDGDDSDSDGEEKVKPKRPPRKAAKIGSKRTAKAVGKRIAEESDADVEMSEADLDGEDFVATRRKRSKPATSSLKKPRRAAESRLSDSAPQPDVPESSEKLALPGVTSLLKDMKSRGVDYWLEVYCPKSKSYVPVHCISGAVGQPEEIEKTATQPVHYVVAFGEKRSARDVTARYSMEWLTTGRKLQLHPAWWAETLSPYRDDSNRKRAEEEDIQLREELLRRPRPTHPQLYRGHPLYVLRSQLAKYEALYPLNPIPVGKVKDEEVYLRDCVALLHTRENWLREAKMVKPGEVPYKEVKKIQRKKKPRKPHNDPNANLMAAIAEKETPKQEMVGLFGEWQVEDFVPPVAENGKVPRNSYGNVELYKRSMLPIGCVYIPIPGINRLAKKMDIDCVAAVTSWEFSGCRAHPVLDGYVVCQEFEKKLLKAWEKEKVEIERRKLQKKSQKAVDNWRKIVKNLLMRKKLQIKYGVDQAGSGKLLEFIKKTNVQVESDTDD